MRIFRSRGDSPAQTVRTGHRHVDRDGDQSEAAQGHRSASGMMDRIASAALRIVPSGILPRAGRRTAAVRSRQQGARARAAACVPTPAASAGGWTLSPTAFLILALLMTLASGPAAAQVIDQIGAEFASWQAVFDASFVPIAITAGLLLALVAAMFSRIAGVVVFVFTVAGAGAYGLRDEIVALAS